MGLIKFFKDGKERRRALEISYKISNKEEITVDDVIFMLQTELTDSEYKRWIFYEYHNLLVENFCFS